jgi:integrase/recombinase XerC
MTLEYTDLIFFLYLKNRGYASKSIQRYRWSLDVFYKWLKMQKIDDIRDVGKKIVMNYFHYLVDKKCYSRSSYQGILSAVKHLFTYLLRNEYILANPFDNLNLSMVKKYESRNSVSIENMDRLLDSIPEDTAVGLRDKAIFELMYGTGLRISEVAVLNITDIDLNQGRVIVKEGKGKKDRMCPVGNHCLEQLRKYLSHSRPVLLESTESEPSDRTALFLNVKGLRLTISGISQRLEKLKDRAEVKETLTPHIIRHSFATHMLSNGASLKEIKDLLGHRSLQTTVIYTHLNIDMLKKVMKRYHPRDNELYEELNEEELRKELKRIQ